MTIAPQDIFQKALALHQRGQLAQAQALYEEVLRQDPRHFDSLHLLGLSLVQRNETARGVACIAQALEVRSDFPEAHYNLGNALLSLHRPAEALESFDRAIALDARDPQFHFERGNALAELGRASDAVASFDAALRIDPRFAEAHNNRGIALKEAGRQAEALASYDRAIALKPDYAEAHGNRGNVLKELGRLQDALASYDLAIGLKPDHAESYSNRGTALAHLKRLDEALVNHDRALALRPDYAEAHNNRGIVLKEMGRSQEAVQSYDTALRLKPGYAEALSNRGNALVDLGRMDEALASYDRALELQPDYAEAWLNRGNALKDLGRLDEARENYARAARHKPSLHMAEFNRSLIDLHQRNYRQGFALYRSRWDADPAGGDAPRRLFPDWDGSAADGDILLWAEQGLGDEVFFASLLSLLDTTQNSFVLSADRRLHPVYERSFPQLRLVDSAVTRKDITADYVAQAPIGDLAHILKIGPEDLQRRRYPYLLANPARRAELAAQIRQVGEGLICGLSWKSGNHKVGAERSVGLPDLAPVLGLPGVTFVNLQYGDVASDLATAKEQTGTDVTCLAGLDVFNDIDGLVALIDLCDVVITIDNLTAHLAGAVGSDTLVLVPAGSGRHWYWGDETRSTWYPSLRIASQRARGDWGPAVTEAADWLRRATGRIRPA